MSRIIKFRAWDTEDNEMVKHDEFGDAEDGCVELAQLSYKESISCGKFDENGEWLELPIMQFTGLKDKNGKEIFEGDIITECSVPDFNEYMGITHLEVIYEDGCFLASGESERPHGKTWIEPLIDLDLENIEVVGNVHETPELLKQMALKLNS